MTNTLARRALTFIYHVAIYAAMAGVAWTGATLASIAVFLLVNSVGLAVFNNRLVSRRLVLQRPWVQATALLGVMIVVPVPLIIFVGEPLRAIACAVIFVVVRLLFVARPSEPGSNNAAGNGIGCVMATTLVRNTEKMFELKKTAAGKLVLVVVCGGIAMYDVHVVLTSEEVDRYNAEGEGFLSDLAYRIGKSESEYAARTVSGDEL